MGAIRDLAIQVKKEGMTFSELGAIYRHHNYLEKLGANEEQIELFIAMNGRRCLPQEKTADLVNQMYEISKSENI